MVGLKIEVELILALKDMPCQTLASSTIGTPISQVSNFEVAQLSGCASPFAMSQTRL
jgi:hypothetical protein